MPECKRSLQRYGTYCPRSSSSTGTWRYLLQTARRASLESTIPTSNTFSNIWVSRTPKSVSQSVIRFRPPSRGVPTVHQLLPSRFRAFFPRHRSSSSLERDISRSSFTHTHYWVWRAELVVVRQSGFQFLCLQSVQKRRILSCIIKWSHFTISYLFSTIKRNLPVKRVRD